MNSWNSWAASLKRSWRNSDSALMYWASAALLSRGNWRRKLRASAMLDSYLPDWKAPERTVNRRSASGLRKAGWAETAVKRAAKARPGRSEILRFMWVSVFLLGRGGPRRLSRGGGRAFVPAAFRL